MSAAIKKNGIKITDQEALADYINSVNDRATAHTANVWTAISVADEAEQMLDQKGIAKKHKVGTVAHYTSSVPTAKKYKYAAICSRFFLKRFPEGWRLMKAEKVGLYPGTPRDLTLIVSQAVADKIRRDAMAGFHVAKPTPAAPAETTNIAA